MRESYVPDWGDAPENLPAFSNGGAHLWKIRPLPQYFEYLSPIEKERLSGIHSEKTKQDYAASQGGLKHILSRYLQCAPENIPLRRREEGKPYIESGPEFNLSHTTDATIAVFAGHDVGIDLEKADRRVSTQSIAQKFFTPEEIRMLDGLPEQMQGTHFLRLWVCKEAMVKLSGEGIAFGLRKVAVDLSSEPGPMGLYEGKPVYLWEFQPAPGILGAVASWKPCQANCFYQL